MMTDGIILDERLSSAAELVPCGAVLLDVGTDHGYLPVHLIQSGKIPCAGASDVNRDPLSKAERTAEKYGVSDKMSFYLSDGLAGIPDLSEYTAVSICGMGGELIARIISEAKYLKDNKVPLILQPMSSADKLSRFLSDNGFGITDERIAFAAGKVYRVIFAEYTGERCELAPTEHLLGKVNIEAGCAQKNFPLLLRKHILKFERIINGKRLGGIDFAEDRLILDELYRIADKECIEYENI